MGTEIALILTMLIALVAVAGFVWALLTMRQIRQRFKPVLDLDDEHRRLQGALKDLSREMTQKREAWQTEFTEITSELGQLSQHLDHVRDQASIESYGLYRPRYDFAESDQYKDRLDHIRDQQKAMIRGKTAAVCPTEWTVEGSKTKGRQMVQRQLRLQLRAFNGECDAAIAKVRYNNVVAIAERLRRAFDAINKLGESNQCAIVMTYVELKLQELYLAHEYQEKKQAEKEEQRRIQAQMREEERARREIEKARLEAEREEMQYQEALEKARADLRSASDAKQAKLQDAIAALEARLAEAHTNKERAVSRAQLTKSGHVYVISNLGSFGEGIFGRLEERPQITAARSSNKPRPFGRGLFNSGGGIRTYDFPDSELGRGGLRPVGAHVLSPGQEPRRSKVYPPTSIGPTWRSSRT